MIEHILDASEMEHPQPFEEATAILRQLPPGEYLLMMHRRIPYPLFDFCAQMGLAHSLREGKSAAYEIIVYHPGDLEVLSAEGLL